MTPKARRDEPLSTRENTLTHRRTSCQTQGRAGTRLGASPRNASVGALSPCPPGRTPATEVLTQGKHLKTEWLPGRRKERRGWNGMGWGMATGRAQKLLKLGAYQGWLVPEGSWAPAWRVWGSRCHVGFCRRGQRFPSPFHRTSGSAQGSELGESAGLFMTLVPPQQ